MPCTQGSTHAAAKVPVFSKLSASSCVGCAPMAPDFVVVKAPHAAANSTHIRNLSASPRIASSPPSCNRENAAQEAYRLQGLQHSASDIVLRLHCKWVLQSQQSDVSSHSQPAVRRRFCSTISHLVRRDSTRVLPSPVMQGSQPGRRRLPLWCP